MLDQQLSRAFGLVIGFLLPGTLGLYALSFFVPAIRDWFGIAAEQEATVGGFLFVAMGSLGVGVFLSGLRWLLLDSQVGRQMSRFPPPPDFPIARRAEPNVEYVYQDIRANHYDFYLFYANSLCAVVLLYLAWVITRSPTRREVVWITAATLAAAIVLWFSARNALQRYDQKVAALATDPIVIASEASQASEASAAEAAEEVSSPSVVPLSSEPTDHRSSSRSESS